jgi:hypothetical protein
MPDFCGSLFYELITMHDGTVRLARLFSILA